MILCQMTEAVGRSDRDIMFLRGVRAVARYTLQPKLRLPCLSYSQFSLSQYRVEHNTGSYPDDSPNQNHPR